MEAIPEKNMQIDHVTAKDTANAFGLNFAFYLLV